jgi:16S rRNA (cytosine1402-N4)-methyltransferase
MNDAQLALPGVVVDSSVEWVWSDDAGEEATVSEFVHATVMRSEVLVALAPRDGGVYVDATLGGGGHSEAILDAAATATVVAFDRDPAAIEAASERLRRYGDRVTIIRSDFSQIVTELERLGIRSVDGLIADLGVSSPQLDDAARGMSFRREGPIDMRMNADDGETALELIERSSDEALADILFRFGDERRSRRIARAIRRAFEEGELRTTLDLRRAVVRAVGPARIGGVDPATRTFQALRIAVNRELDELADLLAVLPTIIAPDGVAAVISFHSLEDRAVKHSLHHVEGWAPLWKKPRLASDDEAASNPRARSAKLRAARRVHVEAS